MSIPEIARAQPKSLIEIVNYSMEVLGELLSLRVDSIQSREERWVIADLLGKAGHIRTVPIPASVRTGVEKWMAASGIADGALFRSIDKRGAYGEPV